MDDPISSSEENSSEEDEQMMGNIQNEAPLVPNEDRTSQLGSLQSTSSREQQTTVPEQLAPEGNSYADDKGMVDNTEHEKTVIPNDDGTSQLWAASNVPSSSSGANSGDQYRAEQPTPSSQSLLLSENGNPICQPCCDEMEVPHAQHASLETAGEKLDDAVLDPQEISMSDSSYTSEQVGRYPVEWDSKNNFKLSREVCNVMARNPDEVYHLTPCKKIRDEIRDPSCYLVDSGYHDTTSRSTMSQQPANATTSHDNRVRNFTELQHSSNLASSPQDIATGSTGQNRSTLSTPPIQIESLGACEAEPSYEVHEGSSLPVCNVQFVHQGYAMFNMTVPKGTYINTLITMDRFTQQKRALLGDQTFYFLQKGWVNLTKIEEDSVIIIQTLSSSPRGDKS
ncbi:uncharacterized protein LOC110462673 [Mizuhopecten yessoensis]|uniref:Uncharacterized protein n=1 Tax=Mizuhopecten yessoensis TaxID=6573 RepID=A0A210PXV2_MIZYE|nr:uncharacterized protein LOC110462673 [Mizuhopecten yessoensis]XP_021372428.1 uncharacterized protein LOC110462673 [Mizuhopecten yessoensis]XP_021372430.1 uncharacterized protein LOC110462673 [Mizuhopecten yessoensis]OWF41302.1 hypothetical protein KP79_PYT13139 [Mizuhopecten yessoensis]